MTDTSRQSILQTPADSLHDRHQQALDITDTSRQSTLQSNTGQAVRQYTLQSDTSRQSTLQSDTSRQSTLQSDTSRQSTVRHQQTVYFTVRHQQTVYFTVAGGGLLASHRVGAVPAAWAGGGGQVGGPVGVAQGGDRTLAVACTEERSRQGLSAD